MKIAVVTGASSGIGREFAKQISAKYPKFDEIWIIARRTERLEELAEDISLTARVISMDITNETDIEQFKELLDNEQPDIKLLVNAAGMGKIGKSYEIPVEEQKQMTDLNCTALTRFTLICLPYISYNSRIINVASASAFLPQPGFAVYAASKAYVNSFSRALNVELKDRKITVTSVCPGPVDTEFFTVAGSEVKPFKKIFMAKPEKVVAKAIKDASLNKDMSIYGKTMRLCKFAAKVLPSSFCMKFFK